MSFKHKFCTVDANHTGSTSCPRELSPSSSLPPSPFPLSPCWGTLAQQREREPEYTLEERADAKTGRRVLHLHIRLPAVSSQKELDVKFGLHRVVLVAEGKYRLDLSVQAKEKVPIKCRFVKKTKTLKIAFEA